MVASRPARLVGEERQPVPVFLLAAACDDGGTTTPNDAGPKDGGGEPDACEAATINSVTYQQVPSRFALGVFRLASRCDIVASSTFRRLRDMHQTQHEDRHSG